MPVAKMTNTNVAANIVLVGFMGAGKSTIARGLGSRLNRQVVSIDDLVVARERRSITDVFRDSGESYFREVERRIVADVASQQGIIIDCGGGVVIDPGNVAKLKSSGKLIYLQASSAEIFNRIKSQTHRPLLNTPNPQAKIEELLAGRAQYYAQADYTVNTDGKTPQAIIEEIVKLMES